MPVRYQTRALWTYPQAEQVLDLGDIRQEGAVTAQS